MKRVLIAYPIVQKVNYKIKATELNRGCQSDPVLDDIVDQHPLILRRFVQTICGNHNVIVTLGGGV